MRFVFFDTSPLIYYLDGIEPFASKVEKYLLSAMDENISLYTSTITDMEYLVYPSACLYARYSIE
jgi:predicted nucleic acid-binding protein